MWTWATTSKVSSCRISYLTKERDTRNSELLRTCSPPRDFSSDVIGLRLYGVPVFAGSAVFFLVLTDLYYSARALENLFLSEPHPYHV
jgi:hypothetical protein